MRYFAMANKRHSVLTLLIICVIQSHFSACYKTEVEITPSPIEEPTTKKSGFFSGIKNYFRGNPTTTTTTTTTASPSTVRVAAQKPPPLVVTPAPLMPLGPRPDTPSSSPASGSPQQPPNWPAAANSGTTTTTTTTTRPPGGLDHQPGPGQPQIPTGRSNNNSPLGGNQRVGPQPQPNLPPGHSPYYPARPQPSGVDLSYGGVGGRGGRPGAGGVIGGGGLAPLSTSTTTTTTTPKPAQPPATNNLHGTGGTIVSTPATTPTVRPPTPKDDFPPLPSPRRPSTGGIKEDFPALPTPKSPVPTPPDSASGPSVPSAWSTPRTPVPNTPAAKPVSVPAGPSAIPGPSSPSAGPKPVPTTPGAKSPSPSPSSVPDRVAFVPHSPDSTTTARPGSAQALATDAEIRSLTETLYTKEVNSQLGLIRVNLQGKTRSIDSTDEAPLPLLEVDAKALEIPTIAKMRLLFNNYEMDTMTNEHVTPNERLEENDFLDAIMATSVMRQAMLFLQNKGIVSPDPKLHRDLVKELWFTQYSRGKGRIGSSGFEHVFVNEVLNTTIIGLHNWVYFHDEEKSGRLDYKGYLKELDLGTKAKVVKMRFTHNGLNKPVNSLFIGTSPELELALYTVCFKLRPDSTCPVSLGNSQFGVVTYSWRYRGKSLIGSAYPEI